MYRRTTRSWLKHLDFIILDLISIAVCFSAAYAIRLDFPRIFQDVSYRNILIVIYFIHILVAFFSHNYSDIVRRGYLSEAAAVMGQNLLTLVCLTVYLVFTKQSGIYSRLFWIYFFVLNYCLMLLLRCIRKRMVRRNLRSREHRDELLVMTTKEGARNCLAGLSIDQYQPYHVTGLVLADGDERSWEIEGVPIVANLDSVMDYVRTNVVDEVLIDVSWQVPEVEDLVNQFLEMGLIVHIGLEQALGDLPNKQIQKLGKGNVITASIHTASVVQLFLKRTMDIVGAIVGLILTGILFIFVAPVIKLSSPGPIFFGQERVGKNGRKFKLYKFRSMYVDAEERKAKMMAENEVQGPMFKIEDDPRIVKGVGRFIRQTSIDEFPQFWNVLKGDMSLVGTRPPTVDEYAQYEERHMIRLSFRPGITGLWQVSGRSEITDFEEVVRLDEEYITNWSLHEDFRILLRTVVVVLQRKGSK